MSNKIVDFHVNKNICEAVACFAQATSEIDVKVGERGTISYFIFYPHDWFLQACNCELNYLVIFLSAMQNQLV